MAKNYLMFYSRLDLPKRQKKEKETQKKVYIPHSTTFSIRRTLIKFLFINHHRQVALTTANNTVTSSGLPPKRETNAYEIYKNQ